MASNLLAMASNLEAVASNLEAMTSNLEAMASNLIALAWEENSDGLQPTSDGLQPRSNGLHPKSSKGFLDKLEFAHRAHGGQDETGPVLSKSGLLFDDLVSDEEEQAWRNRRQDNMGS